MITVCISATSNPRGPGFWKLNTHLLTETDYVTLIKKTIIDVSKDYKDQNEVDAILLWDVIKMQIRAASIRYASTKKLHLKQKELSLDTDTKEKQTSTVFEKLETYKSLKYRLQNSG